MANNILQNNKVSSSDLLNIKQQSLYARLKRLYSTDILARNIGGKKLKIKDTSELMYALDRNSLRDRFNRVRSTSYNAYTRDFALSYQAARMDLFRDYDCVGPDTIVPLPDGTKPTIKELAEKYKDKPQERFYVYSYDNISKSIKLGKAYHPRKKKGTRYGYKVTFDNGQYVIGSIKHPFMMRDGTYKRILELNVGDSVMPFYQKDFYGHGYRHIYNFSKGWQTEHKIVAEQFNRPLKENEVVHHKNFKKGCNLPENLQIMTNSDHSSYHMNLINKKIWSPENKPNMLNKMFNSVGYKNRKFHHWNGQRSGKNNPFFGKINTNESNKKRSESLKELLKYKNQNGENNPNYRDDITIDVLKVKASEYYKNNGKLTSWGLINDIGCDYSILQSRLKSSNLDWETFKNDVISTLNHKIVSIECIGPVDVYDVTVEEYQNFATDSCFVHNTMDMDPIISAALDIYADECVSGETIIPLLDGTKQSIESLYNDKKTNFLVYSINENGYNITQLCEKVAYNGKKEMIKLVLDDGTIIKCTSNHVWVNDKNIQLTTDKLLVGDTLFGFNSVNHKIVSIEKLDGLYNAYDLVNVGNSTHLYAIECKDGSKLITHNCITENEFGEVISIDSRDNNIKEILHNLFYDVLNVEFNLYSWIRNMCKYGDFYLRLNISPEYGVFMVEPMSAYNVERIENSDPTNKNYVKFQVRPVDTSQAEMLEAFQVAHFRLLGDSNFAPYGKCLSGDTNIWTSNGYKLLKDISIGDNVYSFDFSKNKIVKSPVLNKILSGIKKTYRIETAHRTINATLEHPFMVKDGSYKQVKDLTVGDYIVLPVLKDCNDLIYPKLILEEYNNSTDSKLKKIDENILKDNFKEFLRFFGFMLGDGWVEKYSVEFSMGDRLDKSSKYIDFIKKLNIGYTISKANTTSAYCRVNSLYFVELLKNLGFKTGTENKCIPDWVWELPIEYKQEILFGFADADGCDIDDNTRQVSSINEKLILDLREISMQCGLSTTRSWQTVSDGCTGKRCVMTYFTYRIKSRDFIKVNDTYYIEKIKSITECNKEEVYDIQVDNDLHNFIANGLVVHNSMVESARRTWKQLSLLEDAMLIHRIMRAPEKRIFKIDIGNIPPNEIDSFMEKMISKMKKVPYVDEKTGDYNLKFNLQNMVEDFYLPVRGQDSGTSIDTLPGMEFTGIDDLEYVKNKMMAALKIPKSFLGFDDSVGGKSVLAAEDIRFARTISRIQKMVLSELSKIAIVHLYARGYRDESLLDFDLHLTNPSTIFEKEKMEIWSSKMDNAKAMWEMSDGSGPFFSRNFIFKKIFRMSDDDINKNLQEVVGDCKQLFRLKQITEDGNDPATPFKKINPNVGNEGGEKPEAGLGGPTPPKVGGPAGGPGEEGEPEELKGGPTGGEEPVKESTELTEKHGEPAADYVRPSQAGKKDASKYPFGEDPLGDKENNRKSKADRELTPRVRKDPILTLESKQLFDKYLSNVKSIKKELKPDNTKTILDEGNILD